MRLLRIGQCTEVDEQYVNDTLARPLLVDKNEHIVHLCFTRLEDLYLNNFCLTKFPGPRDKFVCENQGRTEGLKCPAESVIYTKSGVPVMCLYNQSHTLHNGTICTFIRKIDHDTVEIDVKGSRYNLRKAARNNVDNEVVV